MSSTGPSGAAAAGEGQLEERVDLSAETDTQIEQARQLVATAEAPSSRSAIKQQLQSALTLLSALEKRCRVGNDNASLVRVCQVSLELCRQVNDHEALLNTLQTLATRRSQKTSAVKALVHTAMPWCVIPDTYDPLPAKTDVEQEERNQLVLALREISDGKLYLERERAILTRALANIREQAGNAVEAAQILQEVHVETYGSLSKKDKVEFILEQLRLTLTTHDYVRAGIVAGKISSKHLQEENMQEYKVRFYTLMTIYHQHLKDALELAKDYHAIYSTPIILNDEAKWKDALQSTVIFLALAPHDNEQQDLLHRIALDPNLEQIEACQDTLKKLLKDEVMPYPLLHQAALEALPALVQGGDDPTSLHNHWKEMLHVRIVQHNLRVVSKYYRRIHTTRLAQLLQLTTDRLETELATMVSDGTLYAKINRPQGTIRFTATPSPEAVLTEWASQLDQLLHLVETTTHLIHKEQNTIGGARQ